MSKYESKFVERLVFAFSPKRGNDMFRKRVISEREKEGANKSGKDGSRGLPKAAATGYGNHGASTTLNSMVGWIVGGGSAEDDIDLQGSTLRKRARDLYAGGGVARSGPATLVTNTVGWGIQPKPKIDATQLGLSDDAATEWERNTLREFLLWAESPMCDAERQSNFFGLQELAFRSQLVSGDCFVLFGMKENKQNPYQTTIRILEADRVGTPDATQGDSESTATTSGRIIDGVEIDKEGTVLRYHIMNRHPLSENAEDEVQYTPIDAFGAETGYPNILHLMTQERPEQRRGIPFVSAQIEQIKQLDRYINAELAANVVSAMFTAFLESDEDTGVSAVQDSINEEDKVSDDDLNIELAPGAVYELPPGVKVNQVNPMRQNTQFEAFVSTLFTIIGASMEIPKEVLIKKYESNYTAARTALLDFWRTVRVYRTRFNTAFNKPIYEQWLSEAVSSGRIDAPGFFDDPATRRAWCGCLWIGASMGHVDPLKEVKAAVERININASTQEQEAMEYNGSDWYENVRQRKKELTALSDDNSDKKGGSDNA